MTRHSLHIGICHYDDETICDLPFCTADAELLASFFQDVAGYESVVRLTDPTRGAIMNAVAEEAGLLQPGDLLVLTYSGHGLRIQGGFGIVASDTRYELVRAGVDGLPLDILKDRIFKAGVHLVVVLDSCPMENAGARGLSAITKTSGRSSRDLHLTPPTSDGPFFSVMWPEKALEISALGHGLFSAALDRALRELHAEGNSSIHRICECATRHMEAICREHGLASPPHVNYTMSFGFESKSLW